MCDDESTAEVRAPSRIEDNVSDELIDEQRLTTTERVAEDATHYRELVGQLIRAI